jgi:Caspase domain
MRLAAIASALAIVLCMAAFGAILLQKASILVPATAPPQATPTESRAPTVADSAAESAVAAPERRQLAQPSAASAEKRFALVIGNAGYQARALTTPANDAGLIAQTLQAAGFDVAGARDLDQDSLRRAFRDFLEKATNSGPDTVAFIYVSGYGVQLEGENYIVPIDAKIARDSDVAAEAIRMSDYIRPLAALKLKASIVALEGCR